MGDIVGAFDVGPNVGELVGDSVGAFDVGPNEGALVGDLVGVFVGLQVGANVHATMGTPETTSDAMRSSQSLVALLGYM